jgi:hypothetical protein
MILPSFVGLNSRFGEQGGGADDEQDDGLSKVISTQRQPWNCIISYLCYFAKLRNGIINGRDPELRPCKKHLHDMSYVFI